jgi:hypothetical protein
VRCVLAFFSVSVAEVYHDYGGEGYMQSIRELSWLLNSRAPRGKRKIAMLFFFCCDESYDSPKEKLPKGSPPYQPKTYVVAGFFADANTWERIQRRWENANARYKVPRFHASHLNAKRHEYEGWTNPQKIRYSKKMLEIMRDQKKKLHAVSCGLLADEYRSIINEKGRENLGVPYLACFKTCIAMIAKEMKDFPPEDQFGVFLDRNDLEMEAVEIFYGLKDDPGFPYRSRLAQCAPADSKEVPALQPADFIAYETFRLLQSKRKGDENIRLVLQSMFKTNGFSGYYFGSEQFKNMKEPIESSPHGPNKFVIIPPLYEEALRQQTKLAKAAKSGS